MAKLVTKSEFGRLAGVAPATVTNNIKPDKRLYPAIVGDRIDSQHPTAQAYIDEMQKRPAAKRTKGKGYSGERKIQAKKRQADSQSIEIDMSDDFTIDSPGDMSELQSRSIGDILQEFGTEIAFLDWLRACKSIEDINEKRTKNAAANGLLISRDLVKLGVIEPIDTALTLMLTDAVKTSVRRLDAMQKTGATLKAREDYMREQLASVIRPLKAKLKRTMKNA